MPNPTDKGGGGGDPVVFMHELQYNFDKSVNKKNILWSEYFSFYQATTPLSKTIYTFQFNGLNLCRNDLLWKQICAEMGNYGSGYPRP